MDKCYWCNNVAMYAGFNMLKVPLGAKEDDVIPENLLTRTACYRHKDVLELWSKEGLLTT